MRHRQTLNISFCELLSWQDFLEKGGGDGDEVVKTFTADFGDKGEGEVSVDIKICDVRDGIPFIDAVMFQDGHEVGCLDVDDVIAGEYPFLKVLKDDYIVVIPDTIELAKEGQNKYRTVEAWLETQDDETIGMIDITTLAEIRGSTPLIDRTAVLEDVMQRADHYEEILDSLYERATMTFSADGDQAFPNASVEKK